VDFACVSDAELATTASASVTVSPMQQSPQTPHQNATIGKQNKEDVALVMTQLL
jgi:hypothetical protein